MGQVWSFVRQKKNREILTWIGGGLTVAVAGIWTAVVYFSPAPSPKVQADCGSVGIGGAVTGATITAGNTGDCSKQP